MADEDWDTERLRRRFARSIVDPSLVKALYRAEQSVDEARSPGAGSGTRSRRRGGNVERMGPNLTRTPGPPEPSARVIIELNADYPGGTEGARHALMQALDALGVSSDRLPAGATGRRYLSAELLKSEIEELSERFSAVMERSSKGDPLPVRRFWRDEPLYPLLDRSIRTVKADACMATFGADGTGIVVAVADSGIDASHRHFEHFRNLFDLPPGVEHRDFTGGSSPCSDGYGHGTHVAGIVAGWTSTDDGKVRRVVEIRNPVTETVRTVIKAMDPGTVLRGVAPRAKIVSLKVLDDKGRGYSSALIDALEHVYDVNDSGRRLRVHCVNLSLGYPFEAEWFAAGHSPLCEVVDRLSRSGVVIVAAAGNDGSMLMQTETRADRQRIGLGQSINDPGNAEEAITVGATHADAPHRYGVSWFSSRGPTVDGRVKPDLVAPGERILSCAAASSGKLAARLGEADVTIEAGVSYFREESGTSMAAPHVAGAVAALLSARSEFIGRPADVKQILMGSCIDLKRKTDFQGAGLLDLLGALQSR